MSAVPSLCRQATSGGWWQNIVSRGGLHGVVFLGAEHGLALIAAVVERFAVSEEAARIRLLKLNLLTASNQQPSLFG